MSVDLYDFDHTIYDGDASLDFYWFCVRKKPMLLVYLPLQLFHAALFTLHLESRTRFKEHFFRFLTRVDTSDYVNQFWISHQRKIKAWYAEKDHAQHVIISASPEFLLAPIAKKLGVHKLVATRMDPKTGAIDGLNCRKEEKVRRLREALPNAEINQVYTDSRADRPILRLAKEAFVVKGDSVRKVSTPSS